MKLKEWLKIAIKIAKYLTHCCKIVIKEENIVIGNPTRIVFQHGTQRISKNPIEYLINW